MISYGIVSEFILQYNIKIFYNFVNMKHDIPICMRVVRGLNVIDKTNIIYNIEFGILSKLIFIKFIKIPFKKILFMLLKKSLTIG